MQNDAVSIVITTYRRPSLLRRAVLSALAQTHPDVEIIVVDDGADAETQRICAGFGAKIIYTTNQRQKGACGARNTGIQLASGEYYTGLDDDDEFHPARVETLLREYKKEDISFASSNFIEVTRKGAKPAFHAGRTVSSDDMLWGNCVGTQILTSTNKIRSIGGFDETLQSAQDADMWLRMLLRWGKAVRVATPLYTMYTDHEMPRISTSVRKISGLRQFREKHRTIMTREQLSLLDLKLARLEGEAGARHYLRALSSEAFTHAVLPRIVGRW